MPRYLQLLDSFQGENGAVGNGVGRVAIEIQEHFGADSTMTGPDCLNTRNLEALGIDLVRFPSIRMPGDDGFYCSVPFDPRTDKILYDLLSQVDLAHHHSVFVTPIRGLAISKIVPNRPKAIFHVHTHFVRYNFARYGAAAYGIVPELRGYYWLHTQLADCIIFPTEWARNSLAPAMFLSPDDPRIELWAAPVEEFRDNPPTGHWADKRNGELDLDKPYLFFAGRITKEKNIEELIKLFSHLSAHLPKLSLVLAGGGNPTQYVALAETLGIADQVYFLGQVPEEDVCFLSRHAAAAFSACDNETQALAPLRQMLCKAPLISIEGNVLTQYSADSGGIIIVRNGDMPTPESIENVCRLIEDPDRRKIAGERARIYVQEGYNKPKQFSKLDNIYAKVLKG